MQQKLKLFVFVALVFATSTLCAQQYGWEWIRPYQPYYKVRVMQEGVFRINHSTLINIAPFSNNISPARFQVFHLGLEQPLYIHGDQDGVFNAGDYIEFYGNKINGAFDSLLYRNPKDQPHPFQSYFSDTGFYYLTILPDTSVVQPMRFANMFETNYGVFTAEPYHMFQSRLFRREEYQEGINLTPNTEKYNTSEYTEGEGWGAMRIGLRQTAVYPIPTPQYLATGPAPRIEVRIAGVSDFFLTNPPVNHHVVTSVAPAETQQYSTIDDRTYKGYVTQTYNVQLAPSNIGNASTLLRFQVIDDLNVGADFNSLMYAWINYPRTYNFAQTTSMKVQVAHIQPGIRTYVQVQNFGNGTKTAPLLYDMQNRKRVRGTFTSGNANFLMDKLAQPSQAYITDSIDFIEVTAIQPVNLVIPNTQQNYEYLIVTHPLLTDAATQYEIYRSGRYKVYRTFVQELYDVYSYGIPHPLAIRRFAQHLFDMQATKPQYLLLLGKGYQNNLLNNQQVVARNLVPAIGVPAADNMYTHRFTNNGFEAQIPVGRIAARNNQEALNYLDKLRYYESPTDDLALWRKNILHISGGNNANEQNLFRNQINNNGNTIRNPAFGANVFSVNKSVNDPVQTNLRDELQGIINNGISMLTFLGHGSATVLDVNFGSLAETNNKDKYPLFYFNGCNIGNPSDLDPTNATDLYGPDFITAANKGVIGWLAHSNLTLDGRLFGQMNAFYQHFNNTNYGRPLGTIVSEVCRTLSSTDELMRSHCTQLTLQGDPATIIHSPKHPDYALQTSDVFFAPAAPNASLDSFAVGVIVTNRGRATFDTIEVVARHTLPNGNSFALDTVKIRNLFFRDTVFFWVKNLGSNAVGNNQFEVHVNPSNKPQESVLSNNQVVLQRFLPGTGVTALVPQNFAIVNTDTVSLISQNNNIAVATVEYEFELDTSFYFNSPMKQRYLTTANAIAKWMVNLSLPDSTVYYWRVKLNNVAGAEGIWSVSSFILIRSQEQGWAQKHFYQYTQLEAKENMEVDSAQRRLDFTGDSRFVNVVIGRWWHGARGIQDPYFATPGAFNCVPSGGLIVIVYDKRSLQHKNVAGQPMNCVPNNEHKYYAFDTKTAAGQQDFIRLVDSMDAGDFVAMFSYYDVGLYSWSAQMRAAMAKLGSVKVANAQSFYTAIVMLGRKGAAAGTILEDTIFNDLYNTANTGDSLVIRVFGELQGRWHSGNISSKAIGPAIEWKQLSFSFRSDENMGTDRAYVDVYAITAANTDSLLASNVTSPFNLSTISAQAYPTIRLRLRLVDSTFRTPSQFGHWVVHYKPAPEGAINPDLQSSFHAAKIMTGDSIRFIYAFQNISLTAFDSVPYHIQLTDANRVVRYVYGAKLPPILVGEHAFIKHQIPTRGFAGEYQLSLSVNSNRQVPEMALINNFLNKSVLIEGDLSNPIMDVTFDGHRIVNGDFVSPTPIIAVTSKDDNPFKLQVDTGSFVLFMRRPGSGNVFEYIPHTDPGVRFYPATNSANKARIEYRPERLGDGLYTLRVQSRDVSGNLSGNFMYEVDFTVENKSTITHFFPYPNPGTTNIRFVFTLTGSKPPEEMIVRIMTINGKIVREIRKDEFGPIRIGQNVSEFAWDGTDQFGDRLANGVYLYQVLTRIEGVNIERRETTADKFMSHDIGKIYLLR
jgi:hypothetical protein